MDWDAFLQSLADSSVGQAILTDGTLFPWIESTHVLMIVTVVGTIALVDLRLLGIGGYRPGARRMIADLLPWTWVAFVLAVISGGLLFVSNAPMYWQSTPFKIKLAMIALAGVNMAAFHLGAYRSIARWDETLPPPAGARLAGAVSLLLWTTVIVLGRWIGFSAPFV